MDGAYYALSGGYDKLNSETDYKAWADFLEKCFEKYGKNISTVLDMACGTGPMTFELHSRGYDMTALDISEDMLDVAYETAADNEISDILWLCQDMTEFELYGTVGAIVCCLDGINHLTEKEDVEKVFALVKNYLEYDGVFVFDINTVHKFENFYNGHDYILEDEGVMCCWQNDYNPETGICDFYLTVYSENEDGSWEREDAVQSEKAYSLEFLKSAIEKAGLEYCGAFAGFDFSLPDDATDRIYIVARKNKE